MNKPNRVIITYICNICQQKRMTILPKALDVRVDDRGLSEYVDVHVCEDSKIKANILFIDSDHAVRSQVSVTGEEKEKEDITDTSFLNIPAPTKTEFSEQQIILHRRFKANFVKEIMIRDKLRQLIYRTEDGEGELTQIYCNSPMGFIEITASISTRVQKELALEWISKIATILEEVVHFDERTFTHLLAYLDERINKNIEDKEIAEMDFLLNSPISVPISNQESLDNFGKQAEKLFSNLAIIDYSYYRSILDECIDNENKTLFDIIETRSQKISAAYFLSIFYDLLRNALIRLEKFQFFTISG